MSYLRNNIPMHMYNSVMETYLFIMAIVSLFAILFYVFYIILYYFIVINPNMIKNITLLNKILLKILNIT